MCPSRFLFASVAEVHSARAWPGGTGDNGDRGTVRVAQTEVKNAQISILFGSEGIRQG